MVSPRRFEITRPAGQRVPVKLAAVFLIAGVAFFARDASAYALLPAKWAISPIMQMSLGIAPRVLSDGTTNWNYAAAPALDTWNQVIRRIQLRRVLNSGIPPAPRDGFNSMAFSDTVFGQAWGANAVAVTIYRYSTSTHTMLETDILFNHTREWDSYRGPARDDPEIQRVALHELGHVIGLAHPNEDGYYLDVIMNSIISDRYTLAGDDIAGAQYLYAVPSKPNIFLQNSSPEGERNRIWLMDFTPHIEAEIPLEWVPTQWNVVASADFNGNGSVDFVWQNSSTGQCAVWFMDTDGFGWIFHVGGATLPTPPANWEIATAADFNGDGKPDLLLQNILTGQRVIWFMDSINHTGSYSLGVAGPSWRIAGSGDFNGDGKADILWQNNNTGQRLIWFMNGPIHTGGWNLGTVGTAWNMVGTGDFNADGKPDILWENYNTGQCAIWFMNGPIHSGGWTLPTVPVQWKIRNY